MQSQLHNHIFSIYRYPKEQLHVTLQHFVKGLLDNQKCVYIADEKSRDALIKELKITFESVDEMIENKQLVLLDSEVVYSKSETLPSAEILKFAREIEIQARSKGFSKVIFSGVPHLEKGEELEKNVLKYEDMIDKFSKKSNSTILCNCNESCFKEDTLLKLIKKHKFIIIYGERYKVDKKILPDNYIEAVDFILTNKE